MHQGQHHKYDLTGKDIVKLAAFISGFRHLVLKYPTVLCQKRVGSSHECNSQNPLQSFCRSQVTTSKDAPLHFLVPDIPCVLLMEMKWRLVYHSSQARYCDLRSRSFIGPLLVPSSGMRDQPSSRFSSRCGHSSLNNQNGEGRF